MNTISRPGYILIDTKGEGAARYMIKNAATGEWEFFSNSYKDAMEALDRLVEYGVPYFSVMEALDNGYTFADITIDDNQKKVVDINQIFIAKGSRKGQLYYRMKPAYANYVVRCYLKRKEG